jgi:F-type H+-transporting ATPase subunit gamma
MSAMDNATKNSDRLIETFTLLRNRVRQAGITRELGEIVTGAEALKG